MTYETKGPGRPKKLPEGCKNVLVAILPRTLEFIGNISTHRVYNRSFNGTLRDIHVCAEETYLLLPRWLDLSDRAAALLEKANLEGLRGAKANDEAQGLDSAGSRAFLAALGTIETADMLHELRRMRPMLEVVFALLVVGQRDERDPVPDEGHEITRTIHRMLDHDHRQHSAKAMTAGLEDAVKESQQREQKAERRRWLLQQLESLDKDAP